MSINMKSLTQAWAKTAAVIEKTVQSTVHEVTGPKALQEYELLEQVGSGGPGLAWKLYAGKSRSKSAQSYNQDVCVWLLDKKALAEARQRAGLSKAVEDAFLDIVRADATQLVKLRHPGIIHVIQGFDESKGAIAMVTEPIFASLANVLGHFDNVAKIPKELKQLELGQLEIKHGLLQLTDSLSFLHNNARLVHRSLSPETVFITSSGAWKLAGFGFALSLDQVSDMAGGGSFHYPAYDADDVFLPLQPPLNYTAPELTRNTTSASVASSDMFSLACLAYHVLVRQPLIQSKNNIKVYTNKVTYLMNEKFEKIPPGLTHDLRCMLDPDEHSRPSILEFSSSSFFRDDTELRALRFLDHLLERDNMQKADFLKAFTGMWTKFDARVLRYKVLPPLCAELRNVIMQPLILPMVLTIAESQEKGDFESSTLPSLIPVLSSATGDSLLLLVKHAALLVNKVNPEALTSNVVPMLVRAYDDPDARMQEEVLRRTLSFARFLDFQVLTQAILPRLHSLALRTTVAAVRLNAILCLGELVQRLDKQTVLEILQTLRRCTAVDRSAPTLMSTLGVSSAIYKQFGIEFAAEHLLPLLSPLLVAQQLNLQQFAKYMLFVKDILRKIEEKRGVTLNEIDPTPVNVAFLGTNTGRSSSDGKEPVVNGEVSGAKPKDSDSWYLEDWDVIGKGQNSSRTDLATISSVSVSAGFGDTSGTHDVSSAIPSTGTLPSFEWLLSSSLTANAIQSVPETNERSHATSLSITQRLGTSYHSSLQHGSSVAASSSSIYDEDNKNAESNGSSSLNFDPFADWPPRKVVTATTGEISTNIGRLNTASITSRSAIQPSSKSWSDGRFSVLDRSSISASEQKSQPDLAEFFTSKKTHTEPIPLKLAPPPGKGGIPIRSVKSNKTSAHNPSNKPLLDFL